MVLCKQESSPATPIEKGKRFLDIILTRKDSFRPLMESLQKTKQTGALQLLQTTTEVTDFSKHQIFRRKPRGLETFLQGQENIVIFSYDVDLSKRRIAETISESTIPILPCDDDNLYDDLDDIKHLICGDFPLFYYKCNQKKLIISSFANQKFFTPQPSWVFIEEVIEWKDLTKLGRDIALNASLFVVYLVQLCMIAMLK